MCFSLTTNKITTLKTTRISPKTVGQGYKSLIDCLWHAFLCIIFILFKIILLINFLINAFFFPTSTYAILLSQKKLLMLFQDFFFHSLDLAELTLFQQSCLNRSPLHMTKPSQIILYYHFTKKNSRYESYFFLNAFLFQSHSFYEHITS